MILGERVERRDFFAMALRLKVELRRSDQSANKARQVRRICDAVRPPTEPASRTAIAMKGKRMWTKATPLRTEAE